MEDMLREIRIGKLVAVKRQANKRYEDSDDDELFDELNEHSEESEHEEKETD